MDKWNLVIDIARCEGCNNCLLAAKDELVGNDFAGYSAPHAPQGPGVIRIDRVVRGRTPMVDAAYLPLLCNHCDDAPCMKVGPEGAVRKRDDGIVVIDPDRARGRRDLVAACPYGAIVWNEAAQLPQTWFFDAHLLDAGWKAPRCVGVCPTQAIEAIRVSDAEMARRAAAEGLRTLRPELGTRPRVHYRNLSRVDGCFIGGSVTTRQSGRIECAAGIPVELRRGADTVQRVTTDAFGDYKFDGLHADTCSYVVRVHPTSGAAIDMPVMLASASVVLPEVALS